MDLIDFLKKTREDVASLNNFEEVHVVIGNSACDLDSTVSAILQAFYLSKISDEGNRSIIPVLNIPREDYTLRTEVVSFLSSHRLEETLLTFRNDLDLETLASEKNLKLTLVDHNILNPEDSGVFDSLVVEIIDHHENARKEDAEREINVVIEPVGSCVTLVVGNILEESEDLVDERIALLATGTILLDTVNLSPEAGRATPKDSEVLDKLRKFCPNVVHQDIFDSLQRAKFDISGLSAMDVLRKDYKSVCGNDSTIGLSTVPCSIEQLLHKLEGGDIFNEFCESRGLSALLLVAVYHAEDGSLQRELGIFSVDADLRNKLETHFTSDSAGLLLESQSHDCIGLSSFYQGNVNASRKVILPLTQNFLAPQSEEKTNLKENEKDDDDDNNADGVLEGNDESGATEIKVVETTDLLGAFETPGSETTNPFGPHPPTLHGNTNNSNPFHVESTLPAQEYNHTNGISSSQSTQQVFNLLDFDPMGSPSPSNEAPQPTSSGFDDLFSFDPFASATSPSVIVSEGSQTKDAGFSSLDDPPSEKGPTDALFLLDLGETASSQSTQPLSSGVEVLQPFGDTAHSTQTQQDDLVAFQPLEGTNQVHDGITQSSFDAGGDTHTEDGQIRSSSPQIDEGVNDELFAVPAQGNNPFANIEGKSSLEDVKQDQTMDFSTDTLESKNDTAGSLLFDFTGDLPQDTAPEEKEEQPGEENHPTQPLQDDLVAFQPLEGTNQVHDGITPSSFDAGDDIHTEDGQKRSSSPQIAEGVSDAVPPQLNNPFANVEVKSSLEDVKYDQTMEFSSDTLETKNDTAGSLLFDFTGDLPQDTVPEEKEEQSGKEDHPTQPLQDDLVAFQPLEGTNQVHDGITQRSFDAGDDTHTEDGQIRSSSPQIGEEVNDELFTVPPQGNNPFANIEVKSSLEDVKQDQTMGFSTDTLETKNDTAGSLLFDFTGDLPQDTVPEEKEEQPGEEDHLTQPLQDDLVAFQPLEGTNQVHDGITQSSFDAGGDVHTEDGQKRSSSPQIGEEVSDAVPPQLNNPFANVEVKSSLEDVKQDQTMGFSTDTLETKNDTAGSLLFDFTGDLPQDTVPEEKEEQPGEEDHLTQPLQDDLVAFQPLEGTNQVHDGITQSSFDAGGDVHTEDGQKRSSSPQIGEEVSDAVPPQLNNPFANVEVKSSLEDVKRDQTMEFSSDTLETKNGTAGSLLFDFTGDLPQDTVPEEKEEQPGEEDHLTQPLQDDLVAFQALEGTNQMHDGITQSSFDAGGDVHTEDGQKRSSSPQIGEEVSDAVPPQSNNPFANVEVKSSLEDVKRDQTMEFSSDTLETKNGTAGSLLFDFTGDLPQDTVPEEKEEQSGEEDHPTQPLQDDLVAFQPLEGTNQVHDGITQSSFDAGGDTHTEDGQIRSSSPQIDEGVNDELFAVPPQGNNPFANVEVKSSLEDIKQDQTMDFSTDTLETKNDTAGFLLFDFTGDLPQDTVPEEKEEQSGEENHRTQPLQDDLVAFQPLEGTNQVHDGITQSSFDVEGDTHTEDGQIRSSSPQIGEEANHELFTVPPQGNNPFANVEVKSSLGDIKHDQTMEFSSDILETKSDTAGSLQFDFTGDLSQDTQSEEEEEQFAEESHPSQPLQNDLADLQPGGASQVHDGFVSSSFNEGGDIHTEDDQTKILSPQIGEEVNAELFAVPQGNNPFASADANVFSENDQHDQVMEISTDTLETKDHTAGSVLLDFTCDLPQIGVLEEKEEQSTEGMEVVQNVDDKEEEDPHKRDSSEDVSEDDISVEDTSPQQKPDLPLQDLVETTVDLDKLQDGSDVAAPFKSEDEDTFSDTSVGRLHEPETMDSGNLNIILEERENFAAVLSGSIDLHSANEDTSPEEGNNNFINNNSWDLLENEGVGAKIENESAHDLPFQTKEFQSKENMEVTLNSNDDVIHETERYHTNPVVIQNVRNYSAPLTPNNSFGDIEDVVVTSTPQIDEAELSEKVEELHRSRSQSLVGMEMDASSNVENKDSELERELSEKLQEYQVEETNDKNSPRDNEIDNLTGIVLNFGQKDNDFERNDEEDKHQEEEKEERGDERGMGDVIIAEDVNLSFQSTKPEEEMGEMDGGDSEEDAEAGEDALGEAGGGVPYLPLQVSPEQTEEDAKETDSVDEDDINEDGMRESLDVRRVENDLLVPHQPIDSEEESMTGESHEEQYVGKDLNTRGSESEDDPRTSNQEETKEEINEDERNDEETVRHGHESSDDGVGFKLETEESQPGDEVGELDEDEMGESASGMNRQDSQDVGEHGMEVPHQHEYIESEDTEEIASDDGDKEGVSVIEDVDEEENPFDSYVDREKSEGESKHGDEGITEEEEEEEEEEKEASQDAGDEVLLNSFGSSEDDQSDAPKEPQSDSRDEFTSETILSEEMADLDLPVFDSKISQEPVPSENVLVVAAKGDMIEGGDSERENSRLQTFDAHLQEETLENSSSEDIQKGVGETMMDSLEVQDVKSELLFPDFQSTEQDMTRETGKVEFTEPEGFEGEDGKIKSGFETLSSMEQEEDKKGLPDSFQVNDADVDVGFTSQDEVNKTDEQLFDWKQFESSEEMKDQEDVRDGFNMEKNEEEEGEALVGLSVGYQQDTSQANLEFEKSSKDLSSEDEQDRVEEGVADSPALEDVKEELLLPEIQPADQVTTEMEQVDKKEISDEKIDEDMTLLEDSSMVEEGKQEVFSSEFQVPDQVVTTETKEVEWTHITDEEGGMGGLEGIWGGVEVKTSFETLPESTDVVEKGFTDNFQFSEPAVDVTLTFNDKLNSQVDEQPFDRREFESGEQLNEQEDLVGFSYEKSKKTEDDAAVDNSPWIQEDASRDNNQEYEKTLADVPLEDEEKEANNEVVGIPVFQGVKEDLLVSEIQPTDQLVTTEMENVEWGEVSDERTSEDEDSTGFEKGGEVDAEMAYDILSDDHEDEEKQESSVGDDRRTEAGQGNPNMELDLDLTIPSAIGEHSTIDQVVSEEITSEIEVVAELNASPPTTEVDDNEKVEKEFASSVLNESYVDMRLASQDEMQSQIDEQPFVGKKFESFEEMEEKEDVDEFNSKRDKRTEGETAVDLLEGFQEDGQERVADGLVDSAVVGDMKQEPFPIELNSTDQLVTMETKEVQWTQVTDEKVDEKVGGLEGVWGEDETLPKIQDEEIKKGFEDNFLFSEPDVDVKVISQDEMNSQMDKQTFDTTQLQSSEEMKDQVDTLVGFECERAEEQENEAVVDLSGRLQEDVSLDNSALLIGSFVKGEQRKTKQENKDSRSQEYEVQTPESDVMSKDHIFEESEQKEKKKEKKKRKSEEKSSLVTLEENQGTPQDRSEETSTGPMFYPGPSDMDSGATVADQSPLVVPLIEISVLKDVDLPEFGNASWEDTEDTPQTVEADFDTTEATQQFEIEEHGNPESYHEEPLEKSVEVGNPLHVETSNNDVELEKFDAFEEEEKEKELLEEFEKEKEVEEVSTINNQTRADDDHAFEDLNSDVDKEIPSVTVSQAFEEFSTSDQPISEEVHSEIQLVSELNASPPTIEEDHHEKDSSAAYHFYNVSENLEEVNEEHSSQWEKADNEVSVEENDNKEKVSSSDEESLLNSVDKSHDLIQGGQDADRVMPSAVDSQFVVEGSNLEEVNSVKEIQSADQEQVSTDSDQIGDNQGGTFEGILSGNSQTEKYSWGPDEVGKEEEGEEEREEILVDNLDDKRQVEKREDGEEDVSKLDEDDLDETSAIISFESSEHSTREEEEFEEISGAVGISEEEDIVVKQGNTEASSSMDPEKTQYSQRGLDQESYVLDEQSEEARTEGEIEEGGVGGDRRSDDGEDYLNMESDVSVGIPSATEQHATIDQLVTEEIPTEIELVADLNASPPVIEVDHNELDFSDSYYLNINEDLEKEVGHPGVAEEATGSNGTLTEASVEGGMLAKEGGDLFDAVSSDFEETEMSQSEGGHTSHLLVSVEVHQEAEAAESNNIDWGNTDSDHESPELKAGVNTEISFGVPSTTGGEDLNVEQLVSEEVTEDIQLIADLNANPPAVEIDHNELDFGDSNQLIFVQDLESKVEHSAASSEAVGMDDGLGVGSERNIFPMEGSDLEVTATAESDKTLTNELGRDSASNVVDEISDSQTSEVKIEDELIDETLVGLNQKDDFLGGEVVVSNGDNREEVKIPEEESSMNKSQTSVSRVDGDDFKTDSGEVGMISESLVTMATEETQFGEFHDTEKFDDRFESKGNEDKGDSESREEEIQISPESSTVENLINQKRTVLISSNFTDLEAKQFELSLKPPGSIVDEEVFSPTQSDLSESGVDMSPGHQVQTTRRERPNSLSLSDISVSSDKGAGVVLPHVDTPSILSPGMESMSSMYSHEGYFISPDFDDETPTPVSDLKPMEEGPLDPVFKKPLSVDSELTQNVSKGWADNQSLLEAILVKQEEESKETDQAGSLESDADVTPVDAPPESITKEPDSDTKDASGEDARDKERGEAEGAEEDDADSISITISRKDPPVTPPKVVSPVAEPDSSRDRLDTLLSDGSLGEITLDEDDDYEDEGFDPESKGAYSGAADSPSRKRLSVGLGLDSTSVTTEVLDAEYPAVLTPSSNEMSWDDDASVDKKNKRVEPIPEYTAKEEHEDRWRWRKVKVGDTEYTLDNKVIEPYKKVLSHGGYYGDTGNAIIVVASCYLPEKSRKDYQYVMQNLFLYVVSSLELLVAQDYMIVYFHGAAPREKIPSLGWMKRCYQMIDRRLRKNLKGLYIVHPTAWLKTVITFTRPFISAKFYRKLTFIYHLDELKTHLSMEYIYVPDEVKRFDKEKKEKGVRPTSGWLENEDKPISSISSGYPSPPYNSHSRHRRRNPYPEADQSFMLPHEDDLSDIGTEGPESGLSSPRMSFSGSLGFFEDDFLAFAESHQPCSIEEYLMQQRELFEKLHQETEEEYRLEDVF